MADVDDAPYWHGGASGRQVGDRITPQPAASIEELILGEALGYNAVRDPGRVYYTNDRELARAWAAGATRGNGSLYRVRPVFPNKCRPDSDYPDVAFSTPELEVLAVEEVDLTMSSEEQRSRVLKHHTWTDGSPQYDEDGYFQPPPEHRVFGMTAADYREIVPRWYLRPTKVTLEMPSGKISCPELPPEFEALM